jgi:hypothetical protein
MGIRVLGTPESDAVTQKFRNCAWGRSDLKWAGKLPSLPSCLFDNMPSGRPASLRTRYFSRRISDNDAAILAHAGAGDISAGFKNLLDWYCQSVNMSKCNDNGECHSIDEYRVDGQ